LSFVGPIILALFCCQRGPALPSADLALINGKIMTMDADNSRGEAGAAKEDRIVAVGQYKDIKRYIDKKAAEILALMKGEPL